MPTTPEHGIIVLQPYADAIRYGTKIREYRDYQIPKQYRNVPLYLISKNQILSIIQFTSMEQLDNGSWCWHIALIKSYQEPIPIKGKNGCQIWMRDVQKMQTKLVS